LRGLLPLAAVAAALVCTSGALAGPNLFVGAAEDGAVWGDPTTQMNLAQQAGFDSIRMTAQWVSGNTKLDPIIAAKLRNAATAAKARGLRPVVSIYNVNSVQSPGDPILRGEFAQFALLHGVAISAGPTLSPSMTTTTTTSGSIRPTEGCSREERVGSATPGRRSSPRSTTAQTGRHDGSCADRSRPVVHASWARLALAEPRRGA